MAKITINCPHCDSGTMLAELGPNPANAIKVFVSGGAKYLMMDGKYVRWNCDAQELLAATRTDRVYVDPPAWLKLKPHEQ